MEQQEKTIIIVSAIVAAPLTKVWEAWTKPEHITKWTFASDDWHAPSAKNDLSIGGKFSTTMAAKDGSVSFDFSGTYIDIQPTQLIAYEIEDGRTVEIVFSSNGNETEIKESFKAENTNPIEMQKEGWQAIINNFKKYVESIN